MCHTYYCLSLVLGDEAGDGKTEVTVETEGKKIPTQLEAIRDGTFEVTFMGDGERPHTITVLFNGEHIPSKFIFLFYNLYLLSKV